MKVLSSEKMNGIRRLIESYLKLYRYFYHLNGLETFCWCFVFLLMAFVTYILDNDFFAYVSLASFAIVYGPMQAGLVFNRKKQK
jgi:hypothetical protein